MGDKSVPNLWGSIAFTSSMSIEEVGGLLSESIFSGLPFIGKEKNIYEEVPAIYLEDRFLGLNVILSGGGEYNYCLEIHGNYNPKEVKSHRVRLDDYLYHLLLDTLLNDKSVKIIEPN